MSTEPEKYQAFVGLSAAPSGTWAEQLALRFPREPEAQAEILALLADSADDDASLLPPDVAAGATACVTLLLRMSRHLPVIGES
jgi:hypothetical protein